MSLGIQSHAETSCLSADEGLERMCSREKSRDGVCRNKSDHLLAWKSETCVVNTGDEIIGEILNLEEGSIIPSELFAKHSASQIATSMVYRFFQKRERTNIKISDVLNPGFDLFANGQVLIAFSSRHIESIIQHGFLNQFVSGTRPRRENYLSQRSKAEENLIGLKLSPDFKMGDHPANHVRPKYAFFAVNESGRQYIRNSFNASYGDTLAVLKDEMKKRTTLSNSDSLAGDLMKLTGFNVMSFYNHSENFSFPSLGTYYEAQVWGPVAITDVAYFLTGCFSQNVKPDPMLVQALVNAKVNVPVYACRMVYKNGNSFPQPDKFLPQ